MNFIKKTADRLTGNTSRYWTALYAMLTSVFEHVAGQSAQKSITEQEMHERYLAVMSKFDDEGKVRWKNYVMTVIGIWIVSLSSAVWSAFSLSYITLIQSVALVMFVWVCLGYRIWVLKEKKFPPFFQYLKMVPKTMLSALPFNALNLVE